VPEVIATSITAKARAIQEAERARNELAMTQAEAAKKIAEAEGDAQSAINRAKGEAESNRIRLASLTPQMLELRKLENQRALIEKWNGQLPNVESAGTEAGCCCNCRGSEKPKADFPRQVRRSVRKNRAAFLLLSVATWRLVFCAGRCRQRGRCWD
jgi:hypothetical protein